MSSSQTPRTAAVFGALKAAVATALIVWMVRSGRLDLKQAVGAASHAWLMLALIACTCGTIFLNAVRWNLLLAGQGFHLGFRRTFTFTWIGLLFNTIIPGAVSGDVAKAYYLWREVGGDRHLALATIAMDRILGLFGLLLLASLGLAGNLDAVRGSRTLTALGAAAVMACLGTGAVLVIALSASGFFLGLAKQIAARWKWVRFVIPISETLAAFRDQGARLALGVLLSLAGHLFACAGVFVALQAVDSGASVPRALVLFAAPLGFAATALPIAPAGIGVGQAAFYAIFEIARPGSGAAASGAVSVGQAVSVLLYLTGLWPYLTSRTAEAPR